MSVCTPSWPRICYVDQAGLEMTEIHLLSLSAGIKCEHDNALLFQFLFCFLETRFLCVVLAVLELTL